MEEQTKASTDIGAIEIRTTVTDLKLRMAEHIITQYDCHETTDVWNILAETKVGACRRPTALEIVKMVFSAT